MVSQLLQFLFGGRSARAASHDPQPAPEASAATDSATEHQNKVASGHLEPPQRHQPQHQSEPEPALAGQQLSHQDWTCAAVTTGEHAQHVQHHVQPLPKASTEKLEAFNLAQSFVSQPTDKLVYTPEWNYYRLSLKIPNAEPQDLPEQWLNKYHEEFRMSQCLVWYGYVRQGCIHLVLELLQPSTSEDSDVVMQSQVAGVHVISPESIAAVLGPDLYNGRRIDVQMPTGSYSVQDNCSSPVIEAPPLPDLDFLSPVVCARPSMDAGTLLVHALGRNIAAQGTMETAKCFVRHKGQYLDSRLEICDGDATTYLVAGIKPQNLSLEVLAVHINLPDDFQRGLLTLECQRGSHLGCAQHLLVVDSEEIVTEIQSLEAPWRAAAITGSSSSLGEKSTHNFLIDFARWQELLEWVQQEQQAMLLRSLEHYSRPSTTVGNPNSATGTGTSSKASSSQLCDYDMEASRSTQGTGMHGTVHDWADDMTDSTHSGQAGGCSAAAICDAEHKRLPRVRRLGIRILMFACEKGWAATCRHLLSALTGVCGMSPSKIDALASSDGLGLLHLAVRSGQPTVVQELLSWAKARQFSWDLSASGPCGITPLHLAAVLKDGHNMAQLLLTDGGKHAAQLWFMLQGSRETNDTSSGKSTLPSQPVSTTSSAEDGSSPASFADLAGNHHLTQLAHSLLSPDQRISQALTAHLGLPGNHSQLDCSSNLLECIDLTTSPNAYKEICQSEFERGAASGVLLMAQQKLADSQGCTLMLSRGQSGVAYDIAAKPPPGTIFQPDLHSSMPTVAMSTVLTEEGAIQHSQLVKNSESNAAASQSPSSMQPVCADAQPQGPASAAMFASQQRVGATSSTGVMLQRPVTNCSTTTPQAQREADMTMCIAALPPQVQFASYTVPNISHDSAAFEKPAFRSISVDGFGTRVLLAGNMVGSLSTDATGAGLTELGSLSEPWHVLTDSLDAQLRSATHSGHEHQTGVSLAHTSDSPSVHAAYQGELLKHSTYSGIEDLPGPSVKRCNTTSATISHEPSEACKLDPTTVHPCSLSAPYNCEVAKGVQLAPPMSDIHDLASTAAASRHPTATDIACCVFMRYSHSSIHTAGAVDRSLDADLCPSWSAQLTRENSMPHDLAGARSNSLPVSVSTTKRGSKAVHNIVTRPPGQAARTTTIQGQETSGANAEKVAPACLSHGLSSAGGIRSSQADMAGKQGKLTGNPTASSSASVSRQKMRAAAVFNPYTLLVGLLMLLTCSALLALQGQAALWQVSMSSVIVGVCSVAALMSARWGWL